MTFKPGVVGKCDLKKGIVTTTHYWERPVTKKFDEWVILVREYINMHSIKVNMYVCGKYLENPNLTWDVDVVLSYPGEIDYVLIRNLMNYGMQLGFDKFDMLVDMAFYIPFDKEGTFWYSSEDYKNTEQLNVRHCTHLIKLNTMVKLFTNLNHVNKSWKIYSS